MTDTFNVVLGNAAPLDDEARLARYRRAKEIVQEAGWLWDEYLAQQNTSLLNTLPADVTGREELFRRITVAVEMKAHLQSIINHQLALEKRHERADRRR